MIIDLISKGLKFLRLGSSPGIIIIIKRILLLLNENQFILFLGKEVAYLAAMDWRGDMRRTKMLHTAFASPSINCRCSSAF